MTEELRVGSTLSLVLETPKRGAKEQLEDIVSNLSDVWEVIIVKEAWSQIGDQRAFITVVLTEAVKP